MALLSEILPTFSEMILPRARAHARRDGEHFDFSGQTDIHQGAGCHRSVREREGTFSTDDERDLPSTISTAALFPVKTYYTHEAASRADCTGGITKDPRGLVQKSHAFHHPASRWRQIRRRPEEIPVEREREESLALRARVKKNS